MKFHKTIQSYHAQFAELDADSLFQGLLGYGMFAEKIPNLFTSKPFYRYCHDVLPKKCIRDN
ncbi:hypothetical protein GCM10009007_18740 [Formosimonas limnophila]|uniref:Uncharacterized protein n=1 Tax=Formosimonas limnophila TaxID=1384487 RepID=A0A8J3CPC5_9BURK|nr:hypothetical protein GCM10009007_18740 [Formosimonas limnophila]